ncbi:MAG: serine hydrolase, partial [Planctomycetales bacterium]|nr:serine hydrolase [Planctomycetales bacterium]
MLSRPSRFFMVIGLVMAMSTGAHAERGNPNVQLDGQTIDMMVGEFMREHHIPGMTLAIVQAPYISRLVGYGVCDVEKGLLASPKTLWNVGQMTQAYTAVAIMQLVEAGKLTLDDPVGKHVASLPAAWREIPLRQLMAHTSGLPNYTKQAAFQPAGEYRPEEVIALVKDLPLTSKPGTRVANSDTDFFLLGLVIERASG